MLKAQRAIAAQAEKLWEKRDLRALERLGREPIAAKVATVQYYVGLANSALNRRREAIGCWRSAIDLDPTNENAIRALAYELLEPSPVDAAELFYQLVGSQKANADDFTCLGEIRIKQDRLGEARRWLDHAIQMDADNALALLALATLYAQVRDAPIALSFLEKAADTDDVDLSEIASAPEFEFLWSEPRFKKLVAANGGS